MAQAPPPQPPQNIEPEATRNLMVNYIPTTIDELQLRQLFERFGAIESLKIVLDRETRQSRGYGFVKYVQSSSAAIAIQELNGFAILNKRLKVALANLAQQPGNQRRNHGPPPPHAFHHQQHQQMPQGVNPYAQMQQQMMAMQYAMQQQQQQPPQLDGNQRNQN